ncbi:hypothetical protein LJR235_004554 [Pararhizobium sp. LjRoot235]|jgi:hypothetical protein|uniref:hypothetical protein n=1 Tax=unclassified Pararhizobium TaxID=2643050 RepID=UPI003ECDB2CA
MQHFITAIPPQDITLLQTVLDAWCSQNNMPRSKADNEAKILIAEYKRGVRSQIGLVDALVAREKH